jgi:hypothetical protein
VASKKKASNLRMVNATQHLGTTKKLQKVKGGGETKD